MDLTLARILKARALLARMDKLLAATADGLVFGGQPRERSTLTKLGGLLRTYRAARGVSRPALARELGIAVGSVKNLERGKHWPTLATTERLAKLGALPPDLIDALRRRPRR